MKVSELPRSAGISRHADSIGVAGLYMLAFGLVPGKALANFGMLFLLVSFVLALPLHLQRLRHDKLVRLSLVWMLWCVALAAWANARFPNTEQFQSIYQVWAFALVPVVALVTRGNTRRVLTALFLCLLGLLGRLLPEMNFASGPWFDYELHALGTARNLAVLFIDVGVIGSIALLLALSATSGLSAGKRWGGVFLMMGCLLVLVTAWISAPSRTSLLALPLGILLQLYLAWPRKKAPAVFSRRLIAGVLLASVLAIVMNLKAITKALDSDHQTWQAISVGRLDAIALDSTGYRIHMWEEAYARWKEYPLTGIGPNVEHVLKNAPQRPFLAKHHMFHSTYIESLLRVGLIGVTAYLLAGYYIGSALLFSMRNGAMPRLLGGFLLSGFFIFLILNLFESLLYYQRGWQFVVLFGGIAYGYRWLDTTSAVNTNNEGLKR